MRITESQLRRIVREEAQRLREMGRYGGGRHGTSWGYGSYGGGDYPRGGEDEAYGDEDESQEVHLFKQEFPNFEMDLLDTRGRAEKEALVLQHLRAMNDMNRYGYSEARLKSVVPDILAAFGNY